MKEKIKLSEYAKEQGIGYKKIWDAYHAGSLPIKTEVNDKGRVFVVREAKASVNLNQNDGKFAAPLLAGMEESKASSTRRNKAATSIPTDEYFNIESGLSPYSSDNSYGNTSSINISKAIRLCQLCYYNFSMFRSTIDLMTEFSTNKLYLRGGNAKSKKFFYDWFETINILDFQDQFFRETYRSSNDIIYRFDSNPNEEGINQLNQAYNIKAAKDTKIPIQYIILNPADIQPQGGVLFSNAIYYKQLNGYELARLRFPKTEEEKQLLNSLDPEVKRQIDAGSASVLIKLDPERTYAIFYKKQSYELMAVPMAYPVLKDINYKMELKKIDQAVARTMQNVVLLVTMGYESKNGEYMVDQRAIQAMQELFQSESVNKVLVSDFTTKVQWAIPTIGDFLDPKKYQIVNEDIKTGLNYLLGGSGQDSKFANQYIQVQLFIQRLQQTREMFLTKFLVPEMKRIGKDLGFRQIPQPYFEEIDLKDSQEFDRLIAQLYQYGVLAPSEALTALESGRLPDKEESELEQENFKKLKDKGYYEPITGGPKTQKDVVDMTNKNQQKMQETQFEHDNKMKTKELKHKAEHPDPAPPPAIHIGVPVKQQSGRPSGTGKPISKTRKSTPMKASEELYSLSKIKDNMILIGELNKKIEKSLLKKHNIKELNSEQKNIASEICNVIVANQEPNKWIESAEKYISSPINDNEERCREIDEISFKHQISPFLASILLASIKEENAAQ